MSKLLTAEEYENQRRRLIDDLNAAREALNKAHTLVFETEASVRSLDRQWDRQQNPATPA